MWRIGATRFLPFPGRTEDHEVDHGARREAKPLVDADRVLVRLDHVEKRHLPACRDAGRDVTSESGPEASPRRVGMGGPCAPLGVPREINALAAQGDHLLADERAEVRAE